MSNRIGYLQSRVSEAVSYYWKTRQSQTKKQSISGKADQGVRGAVTGGSQMDAFIRLISELVIEREITYIQKESIHLVVTSPPYWTLKRYNEHEKQMGHISEYETFLDELSKVWEEVYRVLVPGGRLVCVVGDVCLSRRKNGRHRVVPLHADISVICRKIGFDNLNPIIWHKNRVDTESLQ